MNTESKARWALVLGAIPALVFAAGSPDTMHYEAPPTSIGQPGDPAKVDRIIEVTMDDSFRFHPDRISVKAGETVRFFVRNKGKLRHEMVINTMEELKEHEAMMKMMPGMKHDEPNMISLAPGQRGAIVWRFDRPGTVPFGCPEPGHMEAGMVGGVEAK